MDRLTRERIIDLVDARPSFAVSLYLPTHRAGPDTRPYAQEDVVGWKNLLREAADRLRVAGVPAREAEDLLEPARRLLDDAPFWQHQSHGLAAFLAPGVAHVLRLPQQFERMAVVGPRFHVLPLAPLVAADDRFYILALSQNDVRLMEAGRDTVAEVDLARAPKSLRDLLRVTVPEQQRQYRTLMAPPAATGGRGTAVFHAHGTGIDDNKDNILQFCQQIDQGVRQLLHGSSAPLVLAAVEYVAAIYRQANRYPHLIEPVVAGNPDGLRPADLQRLAWPVVEPHLRAGQHAVLTRYWQAVATDRTTRQIENILPAAADGRVEALFVQEGAERWGRFDERTRKVVVHDEPEAGDEDLLNAAAAETLSTGGAVLLLGRDEMPDPAGALLRY
jgi:hypothetical protein